MLIRSLMFLTIACLFNNNEASKDLPLRVLQKFLHLVEENNLNVSIVTSRAKYWTNGQLQDIRDNALLLPPNNVHLTESQLTTRIGKQWLSDVKQLKRSRMIATYRVIDIDGEETKTDLSESSDSLQIPLSPSHVSIIKPKNNGSSGFSSVSRKQRVQYDFNITNEDDQNERISVTALFVNVSTTVAKSDDMPETEIEQIREIIPKVWFLMSDLDLKVEYLSKYLDDAIPLDGAQWKTLVGTGGIYFSYAMKWVMLKIDGTDVVVFAQ